MSSTSADRWERVEAALDVLLQAPEENRAALLNQLAGDDAELQAELTTLLSAYTEAGGFLTDSAEAFAAPYLAHAAALEPAEKTGDVVGRYRLLQPLGRGGMGIVWLAERADGAFEQRVALKLVKRGMDTDEILARFLHERQILARLEHPGIARLLDGGVSDDGRPYFVMEYVAGVAVTDYCDRRRLSVDERLRLFTVACRAVAYAHRNLVVHRDIKPGNVLVDDAGALKLLDFGIARLVTADAEATRTAARLMTPEYASPEQRSGGVVTTASDVYQLGLLLYELLTGARPSKDVRRPSTAVRRPITLGRPHSSSRVEPAAVSALRGTTPDRLHRQLRGDLDAIALRALREEPERRYPSAEALAEDIERHLADLPIRFGGDSGSYRAAKFVRRHRFAVTTATGIAILVTSLLALGVTRIRRERDVARYEADKATEIAQLMGRFLRGWNPDASDRGEVSAQTVLREAAIRAERELGDRPDMLAATLSLLGDFNTSLGEWRTADSLLQRALAIQSTAASGPRADVASTLARRGRLYTLTAQWDKGIADLARSVQLHQAAYGARHLETLRVQRELAVALRSAKRYHDAELVLRAVLQSMDRRARTTSPFALEVASELGYALYQQAQFQEAIATLRSAREQQRILFGDANAATLLTTRWLGSALRDQGQLDEAEALYRDVLRHARALYGERHPQTDGAMFVLSMVIQRRGDFAEAERVARQSLEIVRSLYAPDHDAIFDRIGLIGSLRLDQGDEAEAERLFRQAYGRMSSAGAKNNPDAGDLLNPLAYVAIRRGSPDAGSLYREAVAFDTGRPADLPDFATDGLHYLAWSEHARGDLREAETDYRRALRVYLRQLPVGHPYRAMTATWLGSVLLDLGRREEAARYLRDGVNEWQAGGVGSSAAVAEARRLLDRAVATTNGR